MACSGHSRIHCHLQRDGQVAIDCRMNRASAGCRRMSSLRVYRVRPGTSVPLMLLRCLAGLRLTRATRRADLGRTIAAAVLACGLIAVPFLPAGTASAFCDAADCVPNVARNVVPGAPCDPQHFYVYGLDSTSKSFVCATAGVWVPAGPLVGIRAVALPCDVVGQSAQQPDGSPLMCAQVNRTLRWVFRVDTPG